MTAIIGVFVKPLDTLLGRKWPDVKSDVRVLQ